MANAPHLMANAPHLIAASAIFHARGKNRGVRERGAWMLSRQGRIAGETNP